jgi:outer membrane protein
MAVAVAILAAAPAWAETKIGVVDMVKLVSEAPQAKAAQKKIESEFEPRRKELVALQKRIKELEERMRRDSAVMSDEEAQKLKRELVTKKRELERANDDFQEDLNLRNNEILTQLQNEVYDAMNAMAKEQKYDLILGQGVLYSSDAMDVTDKILEKLK